MFNYQLTSFSLTRNIAASPLAVFEAWLDPATPGNPWHRATCEEVVLEPKVGGLFFFKRLSATGVEFPHYGRFLRLDPGKRLEYTWMSPVTRGLESLVCVELEAKGNDTLLVLRHSKLPDDELGKMHDSGWNECVGRFAETLQMLRR